MNRRIRLSESELYRIIESSVNRILMESRKPNGRVVESMESISIAPDTDEIEVSDSSISTSWNGGISYTGDIASLRGQYDDDALRDAFQTAIAMTSRPWQLERMLNSYFGIDGKVGMSGSGSLNEMDGKTYINAAKKRLQQFRAEPDPKKRKKFFDSYYALMRKGIETLDNDLVDDMKYDKMGDKLQGKHSPRFELTSDLFDGPYGALKGYNKGGNYMFSAAKDRHYDSHGNFVKPSKFFRDKEVADRYIKANDELWDYENGNYYYDSIKDGGEGKWKKRK